MKKNLLTLTMMLASIFSYAQWITQNTGFPSPSRGIYDISTVNNNAAWAVAYDGITAASNVQDFTRTTDGGNTWMAGRVTAPANYHFSNLSALDASTAWVCMYDAVAGNGGGIFKTSDGGATWNQQGAGVIFNATSFPNIVHFWNATEGIAIGDPNPAPEYEIYTSADGGATWTPVPGANIPDATAGEFGIVNHFSVIGDNIWFDTNKGRVYHSADKGMTWTVANTGITVPANGAFDMKFMDANNGIARLYSGGINTFLKRSTDGGATWTDFNITGRFLGNSFEHVPGTPSTLISTGSGPLTILGSLGSSYSNDGGMNWTDINGDTATQRLAIGFVDNVTGWVGGFNTDSITGGIFKYDGAPLSIKNTEGKEVYFNIYPNPAAGNVTVHMSNGENADLQVNIFDMTGREVYNANLGKAGVFLLKEINLSFLSKGIYAAKFVNGNVNFSRMISIH